MKPGEALRRRQLAGLPTRIALRHVGKIAGRIGAVVRGLGSPIERPRQPGAPRPPAVAAAVPAMVPAAAVPIADTVVHAGEATVQSMVKSATVKRASVKPTGVKPTMEPATVKS